MRSLEKYLSDYLSMPDEFIQHDMGRVEIRKQFDKQSKQQDEVMVTFGTRDIRDAVKANAANLANHPDAGMRLHIPDHLKKTFKQLMSLSNELKMTNPEIKRNIKFNEDSLNLFMDLQTTREGPWGRILPEQATAVLAGRKKKTDVMRDMAAEEIADLLGSRTSDQE